MRSKGFGFFGAGLDESAWKVFAIVEGNFYNRGVHQIQTLLATRVHKSSVKGLSVTTINIPSIMQVTIKTLQQTKHPLEITPTETVLDLKNRLADILLGKPTWDRQKLIHSGRVLVNEMTVEAAGIKDGDFMVVMVAPPVTKAERKEEERKLESKEESPKTNYQQ